MAELPYRRILLKVSGEILAGKQAYGIDPMVVGSLVRQVKSVVDRGLQVGIEIGANLIMKGTKVDGVFDDDPATNPQAKKFPRLTFEEMIENKLRVMYLNAVTLCMENQLPIVGFSRRDPFGNIQQEGNLLKAATGDQIGTLVTGEAS